MNKSIIPDLESLGSDVFEHHPNDLLFHPPMVKNNWGQASLTRSPSGITAVTYPPYSAAVLPDSPWATSYATTAECYINGKLAVSYFNTEDTIKYSWFPHKAVRETHIAGLDMRTETWMPYGSTSLCQLIQLQADDEGEYTLGVSLRPSVGLRIDGENPSEPVCESSPGVEIQDLSHLSCHSSSKAYTLQSVECLETCRSESLTSSGMYEASFSLKKGDTIQFLYIITLGSDRNIIKQDKHIRETTLSDLLTGHHKNVQELYQSFFIKNEGPLSGALPVLATDNEALRKLYYAAVNTLFVSFCDAPNSQYGPTFRAIGPRIHHTRTFPWDLAMCPIALCLLAPEVIKRHLDLWLSDRLDLHSHSCYLNGKMFGNWYPANYWSILKLAFWYDHVTDDRIWLEKNIDKLHSLAYKWQEDKDEEWSIGRYDRSFLLEVVHEYKGFSAGMNATHVEGLRLFASLARKTGKYQDAESAEQQAKGLAEKIIKHLYDAESGWWLTGTEKSHLRLVRHVFDISHTLLFMKEDLDPEIINKSVENFWKELANDHWLHALSPYDSDASGGVRADHSWTGSFPAWPALILKILLLQNPDNLKSSLSQWMEGLGKTAGHGVFGQAHFSDAIIHNYKSGAQKVPSELPYKNEWYNNTGGTFIDTILEGWFRYTTETENTVSSLIGKQEGDKINFL